MPQKPLTPEKIEELRSLRSQGLKVREVAAKADVSQGAVSNHTRDIPRPAARAPAVNKRATKPRVEGKTFRDPAAEAALDEETKELANRVKRARLQGELDEIEDRKRQRERLEELETRERELRLKLDEATSKGGGGASQDILALRQELAELREARHAQDLAFLRATFEGRIDALQQSLGQPRTGLTEYDLMSQLFTKGERAIYRIGDQAHSLFSEVRDDHLTREAIGLGIDLDTYQELLKERKPSEIDRAEQAELLKLQIEAQDRQLTDEESKRMSELWEKQARAQNAWRGRRQQILNIISQRGGGRQPAVTLTGREGRVPTPGEPQPAVLKAESRLVTCSRCQTTFDVDLVEARQAAAGGKKLYVNCANPKCQFLLDISELLPELAKAQWPECYQATSSGCAIKGTYANCRDCQWRDVATVVSE